MERIINFDMDGTIVDFYGVDNWLDYLINQDTTPYAIAKPLLRMNVLARYLNILSNMGYTINIISWLAKNSTTNFDNEVTKVKKQWLATHLKSVQFNNIYIVPYGTPKQNFSNGILFDDEENNRNSWNDTAYNEKNILNILKNLIEMG